MSESLGVQARPPRFSVVRDRECGPVPLRQLLLRVLASLAVVSACEVLTYSLQSYMLLWQAYVLSIGFSGVAAGAAVHFALRRREQSDKAWRDETASRQALEQYCLLFDNSIDGFFQTTSQGRYLTANPALARLYGYASPSDLITGLNDIGSQLYLKADRRDAFRLQLQTHPEIRDFEAQIVRKDGSVRWISENARAVRDEGGALLYYEGSVIDITDRKETEETLREREARYRQMFENSLAMQWLVDPDTLRIVDANPAACGFYGYSRNDLARLTLHDIDAMQSRTTEDAVRLACGAGQHTFETRHRLRSGEVRDVAVYASVVTIHGVQRMYSILLDITERKVAEEQLRHQALHDTLTNLPNRLLFSDRLRGALVRMARKKTGIAVLFVDLDNFKIVNDSMGHEAGDTLLKTVAHRLRTAARTADTIARLGGDEFTLLLEDLAGVEEAAEVAERIVAQLRQPLAIEGRSCFVSASIGLVFCRDSTVDPDHLLRDADTAMYEAKVRGKSGYVLFTPDMNADVVERMEIETGLRFAVERGELRVHYQPLIDLKTGLLSGVEALMRWEHPTRGLLAPGKFIAIAEETGLIIPIGYWALEEACRQMQAWKASRPGMRSIVLNVNLSGKQLQRADVVDRIEAALIGTGMPPHCLKLEITESVLMADTEATIATLVRLKALGVQLAMDDFGTGYSSLATLSLYPLDSIKIDRSFVQRLGDQEEANSVIAAIVMLSKSLNLDITGEGIETEEQLVLLKGLGCNIGQGFYFARPQPPDVLDLKADAYQKPFLPAELDAGFLHLSARRRAA